MKIALINGSPKVKNSASGTLLDDLKSYFGEQTEIVEFGFHVAQMPAETIEELANADAWVFAFPRFMYRMAAQLGWRQTIKANGGKAKDLGKRLA